MNYEDNYHPSKNNEIDKQNNFIDDVKKLDPGYNEIYRIVDTPNGKRKNKKIVVYNSGSVGSQIRDAVTGMYTKNLVGSRDEDLYFSLILATGESSKGPLTLFFNSPEQCEIHLHSELGMKIKTKWNNKELKQSR